MIIKFPTWRRTVFRFRVWTGKLRPIKGFVVPAVVGLALGVLGFVAVEHGDAGPALSQQASLSARQDGPERIRVRASDGGNARGQEGIRVRVIDGDTFEDRATGERIRQANIDTPETGGRENCAAERQAGERATAEARRLVSNADRVSVRRTGREDQYGRTIGFVEVDGQDIGRLLMDAGLARSWRGRREPWCAADGSLLP